MLILSDEQISALIQESKPIPNGLRPFTRLVERHQHRRRDYDVTCASGSCFVIAIRQSMLNTFDFSAILGYKLPSVNTIFRLRRYNGKSHYHTNSIENERFRDFHVHMATERYQKSGSKEDQFAVIDRRYFDIDGAVDCLLADCGFRSPMEDSPIFKGRI
jgi:hypothetical protein